MKETNESFQAKRRDQTKLFNCIKCGIITYYTVSHA